MNLKDCQTLKRINHKRSLLGKFYLDFFSIHYTLTIQRFKGHLRIVQYHIQTLFNITHCSLIVKVIYLRQAEGAYFFFINTKSWIVSAYRDSRSFKIIVNPWILNRHNAPLGLNQRMLSLIAESRSYSFFNRNGMS